MAQTWSESSIEVAGGQVELLSGGSGEPLVVLHHDIGNPGWLPFYQALAQQFTVYVPSHPGYGKSDRLELDAQRPRPGDCPSMVGERAQA